MMAFLFHHLKVSTFLSINSDRELVTLSEKTFVVSIMQFV